MKNLSVVIISGDHWGRYVGRLVESLRLHWQPGEIIVIDNASPEAYELHNGCRIVRFNERLSYPAALNVGLREARGEYIALMNDDVLVWRPLQTLFCPDTLYGFCIHELVKDDPRSWYLISSCYIAHRGLFDTVGKFDEYLAPMYFEDADYSIRARCAGFNLVKLDWDSFGVYHFANERADERQAHRNEHSEAYQRNREYVRAKHGL